MKLKLKLKLRLKPIKKGNKDGNGRMPSSSFSPSSLIYFIPFQFRAHFMHMILILAKHMYMCEDIGRVFLSPSPDFPAHFAWLVIEFVLVEKWKWNCQPGKMTISAHTSVVYTLNKYWEKVVGFITILICNTLFLSIHLLKDS